MPIELKHPKKRLINIKNNDQKYFLWRHVRHFNPIKENPERITKIDKNIVCNLNYDEIKFPVDEKDFKNIEVQNNICINVFRYENQLVLPIYVSDQTFKSSIDLLILIDDDKSYYVYNKDFNTFMFHKTKNKNKKWFCKSCLQCFSSENVLTKHKEDCLSINGQQSVNLEEVIIEFESYFKHLPVPFKIYAGFECNSRDIEIYEGSYTKNIMSMFLVVLLIKLFVLMIGLLSQLLFIEVNMLLMNLLNQFLKSINIAEK